MHDWSHDTYRVRSQPDIGGRGRRYTVFDAVDDPCAFAKAKRQDPSGFYYRVSQLEHTEIFSARALKSVRSSLGRLHEGSTSIQVRLPGTGELGQGGQVLGGLRIDLQGRAASWTILDAAGKEIGEVLARPGSKPPARKFFGFARVSLPGSYDITLGGRPAAVLHRRFGYDEANYDIGRSKDAPIDPRLLVSLATYMDILKDQTPRFLNK